MLTRSVVFVDRTWTNTSSSEFVSPGTRLFALESKTTTSPEASIAGRVLVLFPWIPPLVTLTRSVVFVVRS